VETWFEVKTWFSNFALKLNSYRYAEAAACGHLLRVAERPGSGFRALGGVYVPFGSMEACLRDAGRGGAVQVESNRPMA
jgi:hypothetical protein